MVYLHCWIRIPILIYGSFTLLETDSGTDLDSDSKPNGYIVLCRTFHTAHGDSPYSLFLCRTGIQVRVRTRIRPPAM